MTRTDELREVALLRELEAATRERGVSAREAPRVRAALAALDELRRGKP